MFRAMSLFEAVTHGVGIERECLCPVHPDTRPSASVNMVKKVWFCFTCKAHGTLEGEALAGDPDFTLVAEYIDEMVAEPRIYPESWLNRFDAGGPGFYWMSRFQPETCEEFRLGEDEEGTPVYPLRNPMGEVLGVVKRSLADKGPKYLYPKGIDVGELLFNFEYSSGEDIVLVEGAADAMAVSEVGMHGLAIYGSKFSQRQSELIRALEPNRVLLCFDQDKAGFIARKQAQEALRGLPLRTVSWPEKGDIASLNVNRRKQVLHSVAYGENDHVGSTTCSSPRTSAPPSRMILSPAIDRPSWPSQRRKRS